MDTRGEMITLPALTLAAVAREFGAALGYLERSGWREWNGGTVEGAHAALRELATFTSLARSVAATQGEPRVIDGGMSWDQAPDGALLINDGDGRIVCELKPALLEGLSVEARAQLAQHIGQALGLITVTP